MFFFDAHIDTLSRLLQDSQNLRENQGHVDLAKLRQNKQGAQFFAAFVSPRYYHGQALHRTMEMIDLFWQWMTDYPQDLAFAGSGREAAEIRSGGRMACFLGIEGGEALEGQLFNLRMFYRLGVRLLTLTWNHRNDLASGQGEGLHGGGLSLFGQAVVAEMNRLGMLIDVSHLNEPGFWDVLRLSKSPVLASHSNARALCDHPRNLTDQQIQALADQGGVIGVNFCPYFLKKDQPATVDDVVEQVMYLVNVGGIQCVGLGSDFDGIDQTPLGLEHYGKTMDLADSLMDRGLSADHVEKIMGGNLMRICCTVLN
ncbi:MAG: dipeptidase [Bacillota bacterium]|jgi:membrane dipeptidase|nr:dipeptidase [Bacillota bacterium]HHT91483.1 membrane dipeptidase [Bacillota bacterium]